MRWLVVSLLLVGCGNQPQLGPPGGETLKLGDGTLEVELSGDKPVPGTVRLALLMSKQVISRCQRAAKTDLELIVAIAPDGWPIDVHYVGASHTMARCAREVVLMQQFTATRRAALLSIRQR